MNRILLFTVLMFGCTLLSAQSEFKKTLTLDSSSDTQNIPLEVGDGLSALAITVLGHITEGSVVVTILNPDGQKQSGMELKTGEKYKVKVKSKSKSKGKGSSSSTSTSTSTSTSSGTSTVTVTATADEDGKGTTVTTTTNSGDGSNVVVSVNGDTSAAASESEVRISSGKSSSTAVSTSADEGTGAKGVLAEAVKDPMPGTWTLVVKTEGASGEIELRVERD